MIGGYIVAQFSETIIDWWSKYKYQLCRDSVTRKESIINIHLIPVLGKLQLNEIKEDTLFSYIQRKHNNGNLRSNTGGLSFETIRSHFNIIRPFFDWAIAQGHTGYNPARNIKIPRIVYEARPFKVEEVRNIIRYASPKYMKDVIILAFRTGLRRGEIYGLKTEDVDFKRRCLMVRRTVTAGSPKEISIHAPKTKSSVRCVYFDWVCFRILKRRIRKNRTRPSEFIFCKPNGDLISPWDNTRYFAAACKRAGVSETRFHNLRHTHATVLLSKNVHPKVVQERLGHSSFSITEDIYSHVFPTIQRSAVKAFNGAFLNLGVLYIIVDKIPILFNAIYTCLHSVYTKLRRRYYEHKKVFKRC